MPYAEMQMRPEEFIYVAWADGMKSNVLIDYQRFEWPYGEDTVVLPEPKHIEAKGSKSAALMLLFPRSWGVNMWMSIEGMEPATRYSPTDSIKPSLKIEDLSTSGDSITREYLMSPKDGGIKYSIQGIEWWEMANWNESRRLQVTRQPSS